MNTSYESIGTVVLTTHERSGYFTSVLGDDIDLRCSPYRDVTLHNLLHNTLVAGGSLAVIDESFFMDADEMALGLERFFLEETHPERLRLIVVCTQRKAGDPLLAFLVMYCGIYNIIYGKTGVGVSVELERLASRDNTRADVLHLAEVGRWSEAKIVQERLGKLKVHPADYAQCEIEPQRRFEDVSRELLIDVRGVSALCIRLIVNAKEPSARSHERKS